MCALDEWLTFKFMAGCIKGIVWVTLNRKTVLTPLLPTKHSALPRNWKSHSCGLWRMSSKSWVKLVRMNYSSKHLEIEAGGGILTAQGDRRRTPGGVYLKLLKEQTSPEEQEHIFTGGPKTKPKGTDGDGANSANPSPIGPLPWDDARLEISRLIKLPLEKASVKITLVGRPSQVSKAKSCVVVAMKGSRPPSLPKGLPPAPDGSDFSYAVFISLRHWAKVAPVMAQDKDERLLVEGYPIFDPKRGITVILAQNVRTVNMSRRESRPSSRN